MNPETKIKIEGLYNLAKKERTDWLDNLLNSKSCPHSDKLLYLLTANAHHKQYQEYVNRITQVVEDSLREG